MRVLIGCECSGIVREAFRRLGHRAYSCDLKPAEDSQTYHLKGDLLQYIYNEWDLAIFHPPCTHITVAGARWFDDPRYPNKRQDQKLAIEFVKTLYNCPIPKVCIENPVGVLSTQWRKPDQTIDPFLWGHNHTKKTHLWLKNLPLLEKPDMMKQPVIETLDSANVLKAKSGFSHGLYSTGGENKATYRSRTFVNVAYTMATQWGGPCGLH